MSDDQPSITSITILGNEIPAAYMTLEIADLKYFDRNPRVYSCIYDTESPGSSEELQGEELQELIHEKIRKEPSVKNLLPQIREHGGLIEPILVRMDTQEVIEGNSRLAAYRILSQEDSGKWGRIKCLTVTKLTREEQDAYLNQIHVNGKTSWSAYEKANFAYVRYEEGVPINQIAKRFSETEHEIKKRVATIDLMKKNRDTERSRFSHYDVMIRNKAVSQAFECNMRLKNFILSEVKREPEEGQYVLEAKDIRDKIPIIVRKPKQLKKYLENRLSIDEAFQHAKSSGPQSSVKGARDRIESISKNDIQRLDNQDFNPLKIEMKRLSKQIKRLDGIVNEVSSERENV